MYDPRQEQETITRLNNLLVLNAETARSRQMFKNSAERAAFLLMQRPVNFEHTYAILGGFLGTFPPAAIYLNMYFRHSGELGWWMALFVVANILTAIAGYYLGAAVGKIARIIENYDWVTMTVFLAVVGAAWGMISGFIGGFVLFIVGAFVAGAIGTVVGALALPTFGFAHRMLNAAGHLERQQVIALAGGISIAIAAFIFGR